MAPRYPVTAARILMFDAIRPDTLPAGTVKAAGYVNGQWPSHNGIAARFPQARVFGIDVLGTGWEDAAILDYEPGNPGAQAAVREWVAERNAFRPETACVYCPLGLLEEVESRLDGLWHVLWVANWGADGAAGQSMTGERTSRGNLIVATQVQDAGGYDISDTLESWR